MRQHKNERMHKPYISMERSEKHSFESLRRSGLVWCCILLFLCVLYSIIRILLPKGVIHLPGKPKFTVSHYWSS